MCAYLVHYDCDEVELEGMVDLVPQLNVLLHLISVFNI